MQTPWYYLAIALLGAMLSVFAAFLSVLAHQSVRMYKREGEAIQTTSEGGIIRSDDTTTSSVSDITSDTHSTAIRL